MSRIELTRSRISAPEPDVDDDPVLPLEADPLDELPDAPLPLPLPDAGIIVAVTSTCRPTCC
jgi:hypothetical protein